MNERIPQIRVGNFAQVRATGVVFTVSAVMLGDDCRWRVRGLAADDEVVVALAVGVDRLRPTRIRI